MDWNSVNWAQVCAIVVLLLVAGFVGGWLLYTRIEVLHERAKRDLAAQHQAFLQGEYARLAGESQIWNTELRGLITEVHGLALALKSVVASEDWNPEEHLDVLATLDARMSSLRVASPPMVPGSI